MLLLLAFATVCITSVSSASEFIKAADSCKNPEKCQIFCTGNKIKFADAKGNLNKDKAPLNQFLPANQISQCISKGKSADKCDRIKEEAHCLVDAGSAIISKASKECKDKVPKGTTVKDDIGSFGNDIQNDKLACYSECVLKKSGISDASGNPKADKLLANLKIHSDPKKLVTACANENKQSGKCLQTPKRAVCVVKKLVSSLGIKGMLTAKRMWDKF